MKKLLSWYYDKATIRKKLVISYLLLVLLPILVLGIYSYHIAKKNLLEQTRDTMIGNVSSIVYGLSNNIERENDNIRYLSYNSRFRTKLEVGSQNASALAQELNDSVEPTFWYFITSDNNMKGIEIFSPYVAQSIGSFLKPMSAFDEQAWYASDEVDFQTHWLYTDDRIYAYRVLLDADTSSVPIGVMQVEVFPEKFIESIYQSEFLDNGVLLTDESGVVIGERKLADAQVEAEVRKTIQKQNVGGFEESNRYMLSSSTKLENGWHLYYYIDKSETASQIQQILATTGLVMGICLAVITVLISFISKALSSRILRLKECAEEVSLGNFDIDLSTEASDEIGVVTNSFHDMCGKINAMMDEMYRLGLEKRAEELKALQAMINPHFLYNTLSSIKWKAIRSEQEEIADITGLLAKFYRTALNNGRQITVVRNELDNIRAYLELQLRTHDKQFEVEYELSQDQELPMPNFLLQPIVENAICHGVEYCDVGVTGRIKIHYVHEEGFLLFHIYNNGPSVEQEEIQKVLATPGKGYGMYNIQERIRMYYDKECGLSNRITSEGLVCFTVKIRDRM